MKFRAQSESIPQWTGVKCSYALAIGSMGRSRLLSFQRIQPLSEAITMATVRYNPQEPGPDYWSLTEIVLYWSLSGFTFLIHLGLGFTFIAAYVAIPFYASEGY